MVNCEAIRYKNIKCKFYLTFLKNFFYKIHAYKERYWICPVQAQLLPLNAGAPGR